MHHQARPWTWGIAAAFCTLACVAVARPPGFAELEMLVGAQPARGRALVETRLAETRDARESMWLRALQAEAAGREDSAAALRTFAALDAEARAAGDLALRVHLAATRASFTDPDDARAGLEALRASFRAQGIVRHESRLLRALGVVARRAGDVDLAARHFEAAIAAGSRGDEAWARNLLAELQMRRGRFVEAIQNHSRALALFQAQGDARAMAQVMRAMAGLYLTLHDHVQAEHMAVEMLATLPAPAVGGRVTGLCLRAQALVAIGDVERAEAHARAAIVLAEHEGGRPSQSEAYRALARVLIDSGRGGDAIPQAERALDLSLQVDGSRAQLDKRLTLASARHAAGHFADARRAAEEVLAGAREQRDTLLEREALELLSRTVRALGDADDAFALRLQYEDVDAGLETALASRRIADLIAGLERDRQRGAIDLLEKENRIKQLELTRSRWILFALAALAGFVAIVAVVFALRARYAGRVAELVRLRHRETELQHAALRAAHEALERSAAELEHMASHDALTGLLNRRALAARLDAFLSGPADACRALMLVDVDHFKSVNDEHGHHAGDIVLAELAARMRAQLRGEDLIGRWGGEEFLIACAAADAAEVQEIATRLVAAVHARPIRVDGTALAVTISIGVAHAARAGASASVDAALRGADAALYRAKRGGRDRAALQIVD